MLSTCYVKNKVWKGNRELKSKRDRKKNGKSVTLATQEAEVQDVPGLRSQFNASLGHLVGPCLQTKVRRGSMVAFA